MTKESNIKTPLDDHLGCFGEFNIEDPICKKFCALSLRCIIERNQNVRMEMLEDMVFSDGMFLKTQKVYRTRRTEDIHFSIFRIPIFE